MEHGGGMEKSHLYWSRIDDERGLPLLEEEGVNQPPFDCALLGTYQQLTREQLREMPVSRRGCLLYDVEESRVASCFWSVVGPLAKDRLIYIHL